MHKLAFIMLFSFSFNVSFPQNVEKKCILTLPDTTMAAMEKLDLTIGSRGEFCYYYHGDSIVLTTNSKIYGPFQKEEFIRPFNKVFYNEKNKAQYFKNRYNATVFGPYNGAIDVVATVGSGTAYAVVSEDSVSYYINGVCVALVDKSNYITRNITLTNWWCTFNRSGTALYTISKGKWNYLFINAKILDSSTNYYGMLYLDDWNNYSYALCKFDSARRWFKPIPHKPKNVFTRFSVPLNVIWLAGVYDNTFMYYDSDTVRYYGIGDEVRHFIGRPFDKTVNNSEIAVFTKGQTIFSCKLKDMQLSTSYPFYHQPSSGSSIRICINGVGRDLPYEEITYPNIDSFGHFALFGLRNYFIYVNINGVEGKAPLSKHGVRARPISIDVYGNTICYYETDDSVYVYENEKLIRSCPVAEFELEYESHIWVHESGDEWLPILNIDSSSYLIYNNTISPKLLKIDEHLSSNSESNIGAVISAGINEYGYWLLQKTGTRTYKLLINNRILELPNGLDLETPNLVLGKYFNLTSNEFVFYAKEDACIYRYNIKL